MRKFMLGGNDSHAKERLSEAAKGRQFSAEEGETLIWMGPSEPTSGTFAWFKDAGTDLAKARAGAVQELERLGLTVIVLHSRRRLPHLPDFHLLVQSDGVVRSCANERDADHWVLDLLEDGPN